MNTVSKAAPVKKPDTLTLKSAPMPDHDRAANPTVAPEQKKEVPVLKALTERAPIPPVVATTPNAERPMNAGIQAPKPGAIKHGSPNSISPVGYTRNSWEFIAARGVTLADVIIPEYWLHFAQQLRPNDKIEVICEDGTWYAQLLVINADRTWAKVHVLSHHDLTQARSDTPARAEDEYDVDWTPSGKWTITKKSQKGQPPLKDGFLSRLEAYQWLDGHIKSIT